MVEESDFKFDEKLRQQIHYDWGKYYKRLGKNADAKKQFLDSLSLNENAHGPMEQLSKCHLERGDVTVALHQANQCLKTYPKITRTNTLRNECIYDGNAFEECLVEQYRLSHDKRPVIGLVDAIKLTELTLEGSIGNQTGSFLHNFRQALSEIDKIEAQAVDTRPLWKIRRDKGECDVLSVCSDSNERVKNFATIEHPLDLYRSRKRQKRIRSMYFTTPTIQAHDFLRGLTNDPRLDFPPNDESTKVIGNAIEEELKVFERFENMLQQREPIYAKRILQKKRNSRKFNEHTLLRLQETIENLAKNQLVRIKTIKLADLSGLVTYVEEIMTNFYMLKSEKVFPKKSEFVETIYDIVGNRYIDTIDTNSKYPPCFERAFSRHHDHNFVVPKRFNLSPGLQKPVDHFLKRLRHTDIPIEKCHIVHQLSRIFFNQERYVESKEMGEELVKVATSINSYTWMQLGHFRVMVVNDAFADRDSVKLDVEAIRKFKSNIKLSIRNFLDRID
ncbi:uncharacterized protein LOC119072413 [Bradysia coprophila]|uniref:uncharacterized protein LOC119072413 n=1 Tax=Bradysia coprophila TaxID=38358 RepID=UPI00187D7DD8|nr:uncharacterized protein LOC119072413 [Bradysia coprophila]